MQPEAGLKQSYQISDKVLSDLRVVATWARIVAIAGFMTEGIGLMVSMMKGNLMSSLFSSVLAVIINLYLFKFANKLRLALLARDQQGMKEGFDNLKVYFQIQVVVYTIVLFIAAIVLFFASDQLISILSRF